MVTASGSCNSTKINVPDLVVSGCGGGGCTVTSPSNGAGRFFINGNALPNAPKWIGNITARHGMPAASGGEFFV